MQQQSVVFCVVVVSHVLCPNLIHFQKAKQLQSDYKKLKDENGALIRVISKLSTK